MHFKLDEQYSSDKEYAKPHFLRTLTTSSPHTKSPAPRTHAHTVDRGPTLVDSLSEHYTHSQTERATTMFTSILHARRAPRRRARAFSILLPSSSSFAAATLVFSLLLSGVFSGVTGEDIDDAPFGVENAGAGADEPDDADEPDYGRAGTCARARSSRSPRCSSKSSSK